jgi:hypothetical protein
MTCYFTGLPTVALFLFGLFRGTLRKTHLGLFALLLLLSLGETAWVGGILKSFFPFYHWIVRSGYWISLLTLFTALLSMDSFEDFLKDRERPINVSFCLAALAAGLAALALGVPAGLPSFWVGLSLMVLAALSWRSTRWGRALLLPLALVFSLYPVLESMHFNLPSSYYREKPAICKVLLDPGRIYHSPKLAQALENISGRGIGDAYEKAKETLAPNWPLNFGLEENFYFNTLFYQPSLDWCFSYFRYSPVISRKLLDYLDVRYLVGTHHFGGFRALGSTGEGIPISENLTVMPKWVSVQRAFSEESWPGDLWKVGSGAFDFRKVCFIEDSSRAGNYQVREGVTRSGETNRLTLSAPGRGKCLLVSSELNYPGWKAKVGGEVRPLERVNHSFRGLRLWPGETRATLTFEPVTFRLGCFVSLLVCAAWIGLILNLGWKRKNA